MIKSIFEKKIFKVTLSSFLKWNCVIFFLHNTILLIILHIKVLK